MVSRTAARTGPEIPVDIRCGGDVVRFPALNDLPAISVVLGDTGPGNRVPGRGLCGEVLLLP